MTQTLTVEELARLIEAGQPQPESADPSHTSLLRLLTSMGRERLSHLMTEQRYAPGEVVFAEGEHGDAMALIWAGRVAVARGGWEAPVVLGYRGPGELVGEMALLEEAPRSASVVALEPLRLLRIDRAAFVELLNSNPAIGASIMASLSARLRESDNVRQTDAQIGRELTRQVAHLQSEKEQLLEAQRLRQETADLIVHDLRNPLGAILNVLQMLEMTLPADVLQANRQLLQIGSAAGERMRRLVDSLLDVSRLETGEAPLCLAEVDLGRLVRAAFERERLTWEEGRVRGECHVPSDLGAVVCDEERIDRAMANLIDNAIKYTPGGGRVTVAAEPQGDYALISVTDTGPGIPPEERERIFERFTQLDRDRRKRRGFGLGLAFCRLAVEAHGGRIWVEPGPEGLGSRFVFTLPRQPAAGKGSAPWRA